MKPLCCWCLLFKASCSLHCQHQLIVHKRLCIRFFEDYKKNENKEVKIDDFLDAKAAKQAIIDSRVGFLRHCD